MIKKTHLLLFIFALVASSCSRSSPSVDPTPPIVIVTPPAASPVTPQNVRTYMVDKNATTETAALFYNLLKNSGSKILIGQQDAFNQYYNNDSSMSDVKKTTGSDPGMIGLDFMFITDKDYVVNPSNFYYQQEQKIIVDAKAAYKKGMAVTFCWHLREPFEEKYFNTSQMTDQEKADAFKSILVGGSKHDWYKAKLDHVAEVLNNLVGDDGKKIPVIFRPFHEFDGSFFWWGTNYGSPDQYKQNYQFTVQYLRDSKGVHNVLYALSPDSSYSNSASYLQRYPGDDYVDILGMDDYNDFASQSISGSTVANNKLKMISDLAISKNKIAALTETGYQSGNSTARVSNWFTSLLYPAIAGNNVKIAYTMFWYNNANQTYVPTPATGNAADFKNFATSPNMVLQNNIGASLYAFP